jgi:hypothetical protein
MARPPLGLEGERSSLQGQESRYLVDILKVRHSLAVILTTAPAARCGAADRISSRDRGQHRDAGCHGGLVTGFFRQDRFGHFEVETRMPQPSSRIAGRALFGSRRGLGHHRLAVFDGRDSHGAVPTSTTPSRCSDATSGCRSVTAWFISAVDSSTI